MFRSITFNVRGYLDRRSVQLHQRADVLVEKTWRDRVARNPKERARLEREKQSAMPSILRRQAE